MQKRHPLPPAGARYHDRARVAACLTVLAGLLGACSSMPPMADGVAPLPLGTVTTFHRKSSGSLGVFDGPVAWTQKEMQWNGKTVVAATAVRAGTTLHDPHTHDTLATLTGDGKPVMTYEPPLRYPWPLEVGKTVTTQHKVTLHASQTTIPLTLHWKVESWGDVTVPAGTFKAYKIVATNPIGEVEVRWTSPADGLALVKRHVERAASHPQGAGVLDADLLSVVKPAR